MKKMLYEEIVIMEDKMIKVKFTSTQEKEFENVLGQIISQHCGELGN